MKNRIIGILIITILILITPYNAFAYQGIDTNITIGNTEAINSSLGPTTRIVGVLQVAGTIISIIALIIIGIRYMSSSLETRSQIKGVLSYYLIGAILVFCTSNVLGFAYLVVDDTKHEYVDVEVTLRPTCTRTGLKKRECKNCGKEISVIMPIDPTNHKMSEWHSAPVPTCKVAYEPTCMAEGKKCKHCEYGCGLKETEILAKVVDAHSWKIIEGSGVAATCTGSGYGRYVCEYNSEHTTIIIHEAALGHSFTIYNSDDNATCLADGTKTAKCDRCIETDTIADTGSVRGHDFSVKGSKISYDYEESYKNTCTQNDYYKKCSRCDEESTSRTDIISESTGKTHDWREVDSGNLYFLKNYASCKEPETWYKVCMNVGCWQRDDNQTWTKGEKSAHVVTSYNSDNNATCTADGTKTGTCTVCSQNITIADSGSAKGHDWQDVYLKLKNSKQHMILRVCKECGIQSNDDAYKRSKAYNCKYTLGGFWGGLGKCSGCGLEALNERTSKIIVLNNECCWVILRADNSDGSGYERWCTEGIH